MRAYPLPHRLVSTVLALLVLAASVGLPVQQRTCRLSGRSTARITWQAPALGSSTEGLANQPQSRPGRGCYRYRLHLHQLATPAPALAVAKLLPAAPSGLALPPVSGGLRGAASPALATGADLTWSTTRRAPPPRPAGRVLLVRTGKWVV